MKMIFCGAKVNPIAQKRITKGLSSGLFVFALVTGAYSAGNGIGPSSDDSAKSKVNSSQNDSEATSNTISDQSIAAPRNTPVLALKTAASDAEVEELDFFATAYSLSGPTASGSCAKRGMIAADPHVLPIGTVVQIRAGSYSGTYRVMDTGGRIKGKKIDIFIPDRREALNFGRRSVKLKVLGRDAIALTRAAKRSNNTTAIQPTGIEARSSDQ